jgi:hypothetical protein
MPPAPSRSSTPTREARLGSSRQTSSSPSSARRQISCSQATNQPADPVTSAQESFANACRQAINISLGTSPPSRRGKHQGGARMGGQRAHAPSTEHSVRVHEETASVEQLEELVVGLVRKAREPFSSPSLGQGDVLNNMPAAPPAADRTKEVPTSGVSRPRPLSHSASAGLRATSPSKKSAAGHMPNPFPSKQAAVCVPKPSASKQMQPSSTAPPHAPASLTVPA